MEPTSIGKADACCSSLLVTHRLVFSSNDVYHLCSHGHFSPAEKIVEIDSHIACAFSGLTADSKTLIDRYQIGLKCSAVLKVKILFKKIVEFAHFTLYCDLTFIHLFLQGPCGEPEPLVHLWWEDAGRALHRVENARCDLILCEILSHSKFQMPGGECCSGCVKSRHPVWRFGRWCWGHVQVLIY